MTATARLTAATEPLFTAAAVLFDEYRQYYGANPAPEAVAAWMLEQVLSTRARIYVAGDGGPPTITGSCDPATGTGNSGLATGTGGDGPPAGVGSSGPATGTGDGRPTAGLDRSGPAGSMGGGAPLEPLRGAVAYGICSVAVVPAALTLRTVWVIRDLFVVPAARHRGVGRALLAHVAREARGAGAHRLSLQTETANVRAIELYAKNGFDVLTDVAVMDRVL